MKKVIHTISVPEINGAIVIDLDASGLHGWTITYESLTVSTSGRISEGSINRRSTSLLATIADACTYALAECEREDRYKAVLFNYKPSV